MTQFVNLLYSLCLDLGVTVILVAHSNKAGDSYSGSTAWLNAVRSQIFIGRPEDSHDPDERVATLGKANYARQGEEMRFRWHDFALIRDDDLPEDKRADLASAAQAAEENDRFMKCLEKCTADRRNVSHVNGSNYAPAIFAKMIEGRGLGLKAFERALERLLHLGTIKLDQQLWQDDHRKWKRGIAAAATPAATPRATPCGDLRQPPSQVIENTAATHCGIPPPIYNISGAASEAAAPTDMKEESSIRTVDFSKWERRGE